MIKKIIKILFFVLILNLIWEFSHHYLYIDLTGIPTTLHLILASFMDVILIFFLFSIISFKIKNKSFDFKWLENPSKKDYILFIIIAILFAFIWEAINIYLGRWSYKLAMPTILGVGLSPLLQLAFTGILSILLSKCLVKNINNN